MREVKMEEWKKEGGELCDYTHPHGRPCPEYNEVLPEFELSLQESRGMKSMAKMLKGATVVRVIEGMYLDGDHFLIELVRLKLSNGKRGNLIKDHKGDLIFVVDK